MKIEKKKKKSIKCSKNRIKNFYIFHLYVEIYKKFNKILFIKNFFY